MYFLSINKVKSDVNPEELKKVIPLHIQWTKTLISEGKIIQAGKWGDSGGMAILKANDIAEADKILSEDPLAKSGLITFEMDRFFPDVEM